MLKQILLAITLLLGLSSISAQADEVAQEEAKQIQILDIAVAADFVPTARLLAKEFYTLTGIFIKITSGSSEELFQLIKKGTQFDVFMSANTNYPLDLAKSGLTDGDPALYALGSLALYAKGKEITHSGLDILQPDGFTQLAIGDPKKSPYGVASIETLKKLGIFDQVKNQLVYANDALKVVEMVTSGQIEAGLVSYGDLSEEQRSQAWIVPSRMHNPIKQTQVALKGGNTETSEKWIKFIETDTARNVLISTGYGITNVEEVK